MTDRRLHHAVMIARHGSFTKGAAQAGLSQSGITKSVADLERTLGYAIFHRTARGALPTERGREFIGRASRLLDETSALLAGDSLAGDAYAQTLRIGVCPASVEWLVSEVMAALIRRHPSLRFDLVAGGSERITRLLRTGEVDVAVGFDDAFVGWDDIRRERIADFTVVPFVRRGHPLSQVDNVTVADVTRYDFVATSDPRPYGPLLRALYEDAAPNGWRRHVHFIDFFPATCAVVAASDAISVTNPEFVATGSFRRSFATLPLEVFPAHAMCCALRERWDPPLPVRAFVRAMQDARPSPA